MLCNLKHHMADFPHYAAPYRWLIQHPSCICFFSELSRASKSQSHVSPLMSSGIPSINRPQCMFKGASVLISSSWCVMQCWKVKCWKVMLRDGKPEDAAGPCLKSMYVWANRRGSHRAKGVACTCNTSCLSGSKLSSLCMPVMSAKRERNIIWHFKCPPCFIQ